MMPLLPKTKRDYLCVPRQRRMLDCYVLIVLISVVYALCFVFLYLPSSSTKRYASSSALPSSSPTPNFTRSIVSKIVIGFRELEKNASATSSKTTTSVFNSSLPKVNFDRPDVLFNSSHPRKKTRVLINKSSRKTPVKIAKPRFMSSNKLLQLSNHPWSSAAMGHQFAKAKGKGLAHSQGKLLLDTQSQGKLLLKKRNQDGESVNQTQAKLLLDTQSQGKLLLNKRNQDGESVNQTQAKLLLDTQSQGKLLLNKRNQDEPNCGDIHFSSSDKNIQLFKPSLQGRDLCCLLETVDAFTAALTNAHMPFFMYGGTLIGSWRHHGIVPWDDDVDFFVPYNQRMTVYRLLEKLKPKFILDVKQKVRWKLYERSGRPTKLSWKFPFVDISFYNRRSRGNITDIDYHFPSYTYPVEWIFPLVSRPFHGRLLPAPRFTEKVLRATYNLELCATGIYNHLKENAVKSTSVACKKLYGVLPFVHREQVDEMDGRGRGCNETLVQGGRALSYHFFEGARC